MATTDQNDTIRELLNSLTDEGPRVSFYQAVGLLEQLWADKLPVGLTGPASQESIRLRPSVALSAPPADLESIELRPDQKIQITTTFLGLYGVDSPLPYAYPEHLAQIADEPAGARVRAFLDLFHHRLFSLLYRAWKKSRTTSSNSLALDSLLERVFSLIGYSRRLGLGLATPPHLAEARMLVLRQRTPTGLEALLKRRLKFDCHIKSLQHRWVAIPPEQRSRIGKQHAELGKTLLVGARLEDYNKVCIAIHADNYEMFQRLLPGGSDRQQLDRAISLYARDPINYEVELTLPTSHIPPWRLGQSGALGRNAWLGLPKTAAVCCS